MRRLQAALEAAGLAWLLLLLDMARVTAVSIQAWLGLVSLCVCARARVLLLLLVFSSGWVIVSCIKVTYLDFSVAFVQALFFFSSVL